MPEDGRQNAFDTRYSIQLRYFTSEDFLVILVRYAIIPTAERDPVCVFCSDGLHIICGYVTDNENKGQISFVDFRFNDENECRFSFFISRFFVTRKGGKKSIGAYIFCVQCSGLRDHGTKGNMARKTLTRAPTVSACTSSTFFGCFGFMCVRILLLL